LQFAAILAYHKVHPSIEDNGALTVTPEDFDKQLKLLTKNYEIISLESLVKNFQLLAETGKKYVVITFDDGYKNNYEYAIPILEKYNLTATIFCTAGFINTKRRFFWDEGKLESSDLMSWEEVQDLRKRGFYIGSHTVNHVNLGKVNYQEAKEELKNSKDILENKLSTTIELFAYPFGGTKNFNLSYINLIKESGYICNCSCHGGLVTDDSNLFLLPRVPVNGEFRNAYELLYSIEGIRFPKISLRWLGS
jgi:peptidoglycan/xylan/chitin deacetylase (PgdA/CDA1 family)